VAKKFELNHTPKKLFCRGKKDAPVLVICDVAGKKPFSEGHVMSGNAMKVFEREAIANGFKEEDFAFITPASPIPPDIKGSDSREKAFLEVYHEQFMEIATGFKPKITIFLGKSGGRQLLQKPIKITKMRGQVTHKEGWNSPIMGMLSPMNVLSRPEVADTFAADFRVLGMIKEANWDHLITDKEKGGENYRWVNNLNEWIENPPKALFVDTEFRDLRWYSENHKGICIQATDQSGKALVFPMSMEYVDKHSMRYSPRQLARLKAQFKSLMENPKIAKAGFNFKIDLHVLQNIGIQTRNWYIDGQMLAFAVDENMMVKSQSECVRRWIPEMSGYSDKFDAETDKEKMMDVDPTPMIKYGGGDVDSGYRLTKELSKMVREDKRQWNLLRKVQMPALRCFQQAERYGLKIDVDALSLLEKNLKEAEEKAYKDLISRIPSKIKRKHLNMENQRHKEPKDVLSFNRAEFLLDIFFSEDGLDLDPVVFTKATRNLPMDQQIPSTSAKDHLTYFTNEDPLVSDIIAYKKLYKMRTTYVGTSFDENKGCPTGFWQYLEGSTDNVIHPSFHLHRTVTGRCLTEDAEIVTNFGTMTMKELGERFNSGSSKKELYVLTHRNRMMRVTDFVCNGIRPVYKLSSEEYDCSIKATGNHPFWTPKGWVELDSLEVGEEVYVSDDHRGPFIEVKISSIEEHSVQPTFDISVEEDHSLIANGYVVHNTASSDPNAQNIPKRGEWAKPFRRIFSAEDGYSLIEVDISQAEIRIAAWMAGETTMLNIYRKGGDIHSATAASVLDISYSKFSNARKDNTPLIEVYKEWKGAVDYLNSIKDPTKRKKATVSDFADFKRYQAKAINFGFIYGMGWRGFKTYAKTDYGIDFTDREAEAIRNKYFETYPKLLHWHKQMRNFVNRHSYVRSLHGAVRHLPNINSQEDGIKAECERQAVNSPVQRFGSDIGLIAMSRFARDVDWSVARPLAFIHDAVIVAAPTERAEEIGANLKWYMETTPFEEWFGIEAPLPIVSDVSIGKTLGDMEERGDIEAKEPDWYAGDESEVFEYAYNS
jgi:uracil-DNA glycosylase family 4